MLPRLILFGLGNPGRRYDGTRHNVGIQVLNALSAAERLPWSPESRRYAVAQEKRDDWRLFLVKPLTFVNRSGEALGDFARRTPFEPGELLVVADDIVLPLGQLRLRKRGSHGGHNGLRSIISELDTADFPRLRIGVGPLPPGIEAADFVLGRFSKEEEPVIKQQVGRALACIDDVLRRGFDYAMSLHNAPPMDQSD